MSLLEPKEDFEADLKNRMEDFIENNGKEEEHFEEEGEEEEGEEGEEGEEDDAPKRHKEIITEEDIAYMKANNDFVDMFKETRANSE